MTPLPRVEATNPSHLRSLVRDAIKRHGPRCSLNHIDISKVQSLDHMFSGSHFEGSISQWNTKNVVSMSHTFNNAHFNGDITKWNVSRVETMESMFEQSRFNKDVSAWNVARVRNFQGMFQTSRFSRDLTNWQVAPDAKTDYMVPFDFSGRLPRELHAHQLAALRPYGPALNTYFENADTFAPGMTWWLHLAQAKTIPRVVPTTLRPWVESAKALAAELSMPHQDAAVHMALSYPMKKDVRAKFDALVRREYVVRCAIVGIMAPSQGQEDASWEPGSTALAKRRFEAILGAQHELIVPPETYDVSGLVR